MKELTEADHKAIEEYISTTITVWDAEGGLYEAAEWGIKHARVEEMDYHETVEENTKLIQWNFEKAERIKELEAEVARWMQAHKDAWEIIDNRDHGASDHIQALEAEVARLMEAIASNDLKTLGRIAQEQAAALWNENDRLKDQLETLQKENEGWDQQAQEVERLREAFAELELHLGPYKWCYINEYIECKDIIKAALSKASPPKQNEK